MSYLTSSFCIAMFTGALLAQVGPPPGFGRFGGPEGHFGHRAPVTGAPYSATLTDTHQQTLADGNQVQQTHTAKVYRDADGRTRTETSMTTPAGATRTFITIMDPVGGFMAHLDPSASTAVKQALRTPPSGTAKTNPPVEANAPQSVKADLGTNTVAGVPATGTRTTFTIPAGAIGNLQAIVTTLEIWTSTVLKIPVQVTIIDPRHGTSAMTLSNISQSIPDPALFQIPSGYTVENAPEHQLPHGPESGDHDPGGPPPPFDGGSL